MGNAQDKPPGSGGGGTGGGAGGGSNQAGSGARRRGGGGSSNGSPGEEAAAVNGARSGGSSPAAAVDTSYLDVPAGALPAHLGRLKNEGNHLFKHGQFADALGKYTQAIDGCAEAGEALARLKVRPSRLTLGRGEENNNNGSVTMKMRG